MKKIHKKTKISIVNTCNNIIEHGQIKTTVANAKKVRPFVEKQITRAKKNSLANYRLLLARLKNKKVVQKLINEVAPNTKSDQGGYTSIVKCGFRYGDAAPMAYITIQMGNKKNAPKKVQANSKVSQDAETSNKKDSTTK